ncbi:hypothetical protein Mal15_28420 [Stieleria maiorica]|uniref:Uncharacterized protein n=1 Tax=Stieleria maiorica TaxID=2795974 RepID=A0A5B9MF55_9BACT|nr:hypothetical protein Mal15_28420 [Stieleria maiorica]
MSSLNSTGGCCLCGGTCQLSAQHAMRKGGQKMEWSKNEGTVQQQFLRRPHFLTNPFFDPSLIPTASLAQEVGWPQTHGRQSAESSYPQNLPTSRSHRLLDGRYCSREGRMIRGRMMRACCRCVPTSGLNAMPFFQPLRTNHPVHSRPNEKRPPADCRRPLSESYPARVSPTAENTGRNKSSGKSTPESTPQPAELFAECIRDHLSDAEMADLLTSLGSASGSAIVGSESDAHG